MEQTGIRHFGMASTAMETPPFTVLVLENAHRDVAGQTRDLSIDLPATHRTREDNIIVPQLSDLLDFLSRELYIDKINAVQDWLWV